MGDFPSDKLKRTFFFFLASMIAVLATLFLVEGGLRVYGSAQKRRVHMLSEPVQGATDFLLCAGDSHTKGIGAPFGKSYPAQLEALINLNQKDGGRRFQVINVGYSGFNTSQAADAVVNYIRSTPVRLHAVLFCAGTNNPHNMKDARVLPDYVRHLRPKSLMRYLLANSRAFRLGQITVSRVEQLVTQATSEEIEALKFDQLLSVEGEAEMELVKNWIRADLQLLKENCVDKGIPVFLMNYFMRISYVEEVFQKAEKEFGMPLIKVDKFGLGLLAGNSSIKSFVAPDQHPNEFGYARIAEIVYRELKDRGVLTVAAPSQAD
jgi:hypothetical protein